MRPVEIRGQKGWRLLFSDESIGIRSPGVWRWLLLVLYMFCLVVPQLIGAENITKVITVIVTSWLAFYFFQLEDIVVRKWEYQGPGHRIGYQPMGQVSIEWEGLDCSLVIDGERRKIWQALNDDQVREVDKMLTDFLRERLRK